MSGVPRMYVCGEDFWGSVGEVVGQSFASIARSMLPMRLDQVKLPAWNEMMTARATGCEAQEEGAEEVEGGAGRDTVQVEIEVPFALEMKKSTVLKKLKAIAAQQYTSAFVLQLQCVGVASDSCNAALSTADGVRASEHVLCAVQVDAAQVAKALEEGTPIALSGDASVGAARCCACTACITCNTCNTRVLAHAVHRRPVPVPPLEGSRACTHACTRVYSGCTGINVISITRKSPPGQDAFRAVVMLEAVQLLCDLAHLVLALLTLISPVRFALLLVLVFERKSRWPRRTDIKIMSYAQYLRSLLDAALARVALCLNEACKQRQQRARREEVCEEHALAIDPLSPYTTLRAECEALEQYCSSLRLYTYLRDDVARDLVLKQTIADLAVMYYQAVSLVASQRPEAGSEEGFGIQEAATVQEAKTVEEDEEDEEEETEDAKKLRVCTGEVAVLELSCRATSDVAAGAHAVDCVLEVDKAPCESLHSRGVARETFRSQGVGDPATCRVLPGVVWCMPLCADTECRCGKVSVVARAAKLAAGRAYAERCKWEAAVARHREHLAQLITNEAGKRSAPGVFTRNISVSSASWGGVHAAERGREGGRGASVHACEQYLHASLRARF
jgi:hypothetical protein